MKIIKRSGQEMIFNKEKIQIAIQKANNEETNLSKKLSDQDIIDIADEIEQYSKDSEHILTVEDIQDLVEAKICKRSFSIAKRYIVYRYDHALKRQKNTTDSELASLLDLSNTKLEEENSNKNVKINSTQRDYIAGITCEDFARRNVFPDDLMKAHDDGLIHIHDMDYIAMREHNCCLLNGSDMMQYGTVINGKRIDKPHKFSVAANVYTQIMAQVASSQYGGQSLTISDLAPFVQLSREKFYKIISNQNIIYNLGLTEEQIIKLTEDKVYEDIVNGVQTMQYQINTLMTCNGQTPFVTLFMYLGEVEDSQTKEDLNLIIKEILRQRIQGIKNEAGVWITPAFPKLVYVLEEDNITEDSKYWETTVLAAKCVAKRMVPDFVSAKIMKELKNGDVYPPMGCRSFLTPDRTKENYAKSLNWNDKKYHKYYGRFNQGVCTINLVDVALSSDKNEELFWKILDERLELCHRALLIRHNTLKGTPSDVAPILWQYGGLARLEKGETIDKLLYHGYSTISLGYCGIAEMVRYMKGVSHTSEEGKQFGLQVMQKLNDACNKWKEETDIDFSVYGTPLESTTYKFAKCLQKRFGKIKDITDHNYITNSYHICVREKIDAFEKISKEAEFQKLSPGGAISYVEVPNLEHNIEVILELMKHMYNNILYAEINSKSDVCQVCGYDGEILIVDDEHGKHIWECPQCKNRDQSKMNITRRTCGYLGQNYWNQGRTEEIKERVLHL